MVHTSVNTTLGLHAFSFPVPSVIPHPTSFQLKSNKTYLTLKAERNALLALREHHGGKKGVELSQSVRFGV